MRTWTADSEAPAAIAWALMARPGAWSSWAPHVRGAWGLGAPEVRAGARGAARLLGVAQGETGLHIDDVFGIALNRMALLTRAANAALHRLPNGLNVWLAARMQARDGAGPLFQLQAPPRPEAVRIPLAEPAAATLRDNDRHLIVQTLQACEGNVSKAARKLGVSRGLIYRHLKQAKAEPADS